MLREYEFTYISRADLSETDKNQLMEKYENLLIKDGGEVLKKDDWGVRKLAFPMKKQFRGHYHHYDYIGKSENLAEVERLMRIDDNVLRFMSVKLGEKVDPVARKAELAKKSKAKTEQA